MAAKAADDDEMRAILSRAGSAGDTPSDALRRLLDRTERTAASDQNLTGQNAQMRAELARLKGNGGSGLPYCWTTLDGKPIYMFKVDLRDGGVIAHDVEPRPRPEDDAWRLVSSVQRDAMVPISAFLAQVAPLGAAGRGRKMPLRGARRRWNGKHKQARLQVADGTPLVSFHGPGSREMIDRPPSGMQAKERLGHALSKLQAVVDERIDSRLAVRAGKPGTRII